MLACWHFSLLFSIPPPTHSNDKAQIKALKKELAALK
jgi:hypothetical protein